MGFGTIIAGIYFVTILIVSGYAIADTINRMSMLSYQEVVSASSIQLAKLRSSAYVSGLLVGGDHAELYVNLTNNGEVTIVQSDFKQIDVILTYTDNATGNTQSHWCYFDGDASQDRWILNSTVNPNPFPAVIDPLDWNPSKTLSITIVLASPSEISDSPNSAGYLKVVLPGGFSTAETFHG